MALWHPTRAQISNANSTVLLKEWLAFMSAVRCESRRESLPRRRRGGGKWSVECNGNLKWNSLICFTHVHQKSINWLTLTFPVTFTSLSSLLRPSTSTSSYVCTTTSRIGAPSEGPSSSQPEEEECIVRDQWSGWSRERVKVGWRK